MNIQSLLNPPCDNSHPYRTAGSPAQQPAQRYPAHNPAIRRPKVAKDAPIFTEGTKIVGHVNYPPHEAGNDHDLHARHREFRVFPLGEILKKGGRHIPYASDKKDFLEKTGRDAFEVFQYTYKRPGEDKEYVVVWDYNVGLVRMTPFFKSCKFSKTVPAKALNQNPGMKDISYSITGGALVCQGYWVPWQAARELAATFCHDIRWALTPVFGNDFPQMCRAPHARSFSKFAISPETVRFCARETARFKQEGAGYLLLPPPLPRGSPVKSVRPVFSSPVWTRGAWSPGQESGYGTDVDRREGRLVSPRSVRVSARCFTAVNEVSPVFSSATPPSGSCSPVVRDGEMSFALLSPSLEDVGEVVRTKRTHSKVACSEGEKVVVHGADAVIRVDTPHHELLTRSRALPKPLSLSAGTLEAAEILVSLGDTAWHARALPVAKRTRRGSRY